MLRYLLTTFATALLTLNAFAQEVDVDLSLEDGLSISTTEWYEQPIVWVGAVVLILLLVFLMRRTAK